MPIGVSFENFDALASKVAKSEFVKKDISVSITEN